MVIFYVSLINKKKYELDQVPPKWYEDVKAIIEPEFVKEEQ